MLLKTLPADNDRIIVPGSVDAAIINLMDRR